MYLIHLQYRGSPFQYRQCSTRDSCYLSVSDVLEKVKAYVNGHPDVLNDKTAWIEGMGKNKSPTLSSL